MAAQPSLGLHSAFAAWPFRTLDDEDGNAIDDGIGAAAGDAEKTRAVEARFLKAQVPKTGRTGQLRKHCRIERRRMRRFISSGSHKSPISEW